nr:ribonuclease HI family protein [Sphingobium boeckii]
MKLFFDGGCRPNPGPLETAVVARGITYHDPAAGHGTNNDAEWLALLHALEIARNLAADDIELVGDSALIVNQAKGVWKCRSPELQAHHDAFRILAAPFARIRIKHIRRSHNLAGIALERIRNGL